MPALSVLHARIQSCTRITGRDDAGTVLQVVLEGCRTLEPQVLEWEGPTVAKNVHRVMVDSDHVHSSLRARNTPNLGFLL